MKTLSILIPVYQVEKHLQKCVDSIVCQPDGLFDILLIDDGSPDLSAEICDSYALSSNNILVVHKTNGGLASARNAGLDVASGGYVTFVDSDDYVSSQYISTIQGNIVSQPDVLAFSFVVDYLESEKTEETTLPDLSINQCQALTELELCGCFNMVWHKVYRRAMLEEYPPKRYILQSEPGEDLLFNCDCWLAAKKITLSSDVLYHWVRRGEDTLANRFRRDLYDKNRMFIEHRNELYTALNLDSDKDIERLYKGNLNYIFACVPNMYRGENTISRPERIGFYRDILHSENVQAWVKTIEPTESLLKLFCSLYKMRSPLLMDAVYSALMFGRRNFGKLWIWMRTKVLYGNTP